MALEDIPATQRERLAYIEMRVRFLGECRRQDLLDRFTIQEAAATRDFAAYRLLAPNNLDFDSSRKCYLLGPKFKPLFDFPAERVLTWLSQGFGDGVPVRQRGYVPSELTPFISKPDMDAIVLPEAAVELKLISQDEVETAVVVVISHDCDLVTDDLEAEPYIEVIVGRWLEEINGNFTAAKSTRTLHLEIADTNPSTLIELAASRKGIISKACLASYKPRSDLAITGKNLQTLQNWLADRYRRSAFPDELVNRFKPMESVFAKSVKRSVNEILGLFIDYDPDADGLSEDQIYEIYLMVVYDGDTPEGETKALETVGTVCYRAWTEIAFYKHGQKDCGWKPDA